VDGNAAVGDLSKVRVEGMATLSAALELNRSTLAQERAGRRALARKRAAEAEAAAGGGERSFGFGGLGGSADNDPSVALLNAIDDEEAATLVGDKRAAQVAALARKLLEPDCEFRLTAEAALSDPALRTGFLAGFLAGTGL
jgi:hypothetical protein